VRRTTPHDAAAPARGGLSRLMDFQAGGGETFLLRAFRGLVAVGTSDTDTGRHSGCMFALAEGGTDSWQQMARCP